MKFNTVEELFSDQDFMKKLVTAKTDEEIKTLFKESGFPVDDEQLAEMKVLFAQLKENVQKLSHDDLESISGGRKVTTEERITAGHIFGSAFIAPTAFISGAISGIIAGIVSVVKKKESKGKAAKTILSNAAIGGCIGAVAGYAGGAIFVLAKTKDAEAPVHLPL